LSNWVAVNVLSQGVYKSFQTGRLERELQLVQLSATGCSYIAIVAPQRMFIVVIYFVMTQSGNFWIHPRKRSRGHPIRGGSPGWTLGEGLTTPRRKESLLRKVARGSGRAFVKTVMNLRVL
jgi:hypothetical protein